MAGVTRVHDYAVGKHVGSRQFRAKFRLYDLMPRCSSRDSHHASLILSGSARHGTTARLHNLDAVFE